MQEPSVEKLNRARAGLVAVLSAFSITPAMAYIDPGTGSMLVQMGLAAVAGMLFYFRQFRIAVSEWFRRVVLRQRAEPLSVPTESSQSETTG